MFTPPLCGIPEMLTYHTVLTHYSVETLGSNILYRAVKHGLGCHDILQLGNIQSFILSLTTSQGF